MSVPVTVKMPAGPMNAMPLRLFISGLAARVGFDIETIEDIKTVVSESCVLLFSGIKNGVFTMQAETSGGISIFASVSDADYDECTHQDTFELSRMIIESLADESSIDEDKNGRVTGVHVSFKLGD